MLPLNMSVSLNVFKAKRYKLTPQQFTASGDWLREMAVLKVEKKDLSKLLSNYYVGRVQTNVFLALTLECSSAAL